MSDTRKFALALVALCLTIPCFAADMSESSLRTADAEQMRIIVDGDAKAQAAFMHPNYILNGPSNTGNVGVVMGREVVQPSGGSELGGKFGTRLLNRRFTNAFIFEKGRWYFLARQASVVEMPCK